MYLPPIENIEQLTKDPTLKAIKPWWMILGGAAILFVMPAESILDSAGLSDVIEWSASLIPSIERWVQLSSFPANTKIFNIFVWLMIPLQVFWLTRSVPTKQFFRKSYSDKSNKQTRLIRFLALLCFLVFFGGFVLIAFNFAIVDTPPCRVCVNTSKWAQLFIGSIFSVAVAGITAFFVTVFPVFFNSVTFKEKNNG